MRFREYTALCLAMILTQVAAPVRCQNPDIIPFSYITRNINDSVTLGNTLLTSKIWAEKDGLYIALDSGTLKVSVNPCVWDFNYRQTLDYNNGCIITENPYLKLKIFPQRGSSALWIRGERKVPSEVSLIKVSENFPYDIVSQGIDDKKIFTIRISLGEDIEFINFKKAWNNNSLYFNELWQRSYIKIEGKDSTLSNIYNEKRWQNATLISPTDDLYLTIKAGDWDIFKNKVSLLGDNLKSLSLMLYFFQHSLDESYLHSEIVPLVQKLLIPSGGDDSGDDNDKKNQRQTRYNCDLDQQTEDLLRTYVFRQLKSLPFGVMIPNDLLDVVQKSNVIGFSKEEDIPPFIDVQSFLQHLVLQDKFPRDWNVSYKLRKEGNQCYRGEFTDGHWKKKPKSIPFQEITF